MLGLGHLHEQRPLLVGLRDEEGREVGEHLVRVRAGVRVRDTDGDRDRSQGRGWGQGVTIPILSD